MAQVKKAFVDVVNFLEENAQKKVASIMPQIIEMCQAKSGGGGAGGTTFHRNEEGVVVAVKCYYHGLWMSPEVAEFGAKKSSASGLNSMCKEGLSAGTKQERDAKKAKDKLLADVASGEVAADNLAAELQAIEDARLARAPREDGYGFETLEECLADNAARGIAH